MSIHWVGMRSRGRRRRSHLFMEGIGGHIALFLSALGALFAWPRATRRGSATLYVVLVVAVAAICFVGWRVVASSSDSLCVANPEDSQSPQSLPEQGPTIGSQASAVNLKAGELASDREQVSLGSASEQPMASGVREESVEGYRTEWEGNTKRVLTSSGVLVELSEWRNGVQEGSTTRWTADGRLISRAWFVQGVRHGRSTSYHGNGQVEREGDCVDGTRSGIWKSWYANGAPHSTGAYVNGLETGYWQFWSPDGAVDDTMTGVYDGGVRTGS